MDVIVTGDNQKTADAAAQATGIRAAYGGLLPDDKLAHIRDMKSRYGAVAMAGDGINDAQAMAESTVRIAMGKRSTDVAMETADVIVMSEDSRRLGFLMRHSQRSLRVVKQNLAVALGSKVVLSCHRDDGPGHALDGDRCRHGGYTSCDFQWSQNAPIQSMNSAVYSQLLG